MVKVQACKYKGKSIGNKPEIWFIVQYDMDGPITHSLCTCSHLAYYCSRPVPSPEHLQPHWGCPLLYAKLKGAHQTCHVCHSPATCIHFGGSCTYLHTVSTICNRFWSSILTIEIWLQYFVLLCCWYSPRICLWESQRTILRAFNYSVPFVLLLLTWGMTSMYCRCFTGREGLIKQYDVQVYVWFVFVKNQWDNWGFLWGYSHSFEEELLFEKCLVV